MVEKATEKKKPIVVAAIQMHSEFADVGTNVEKAASWIREAQRQGAQWIMLPELFTSGLAWDPQMKSASVPLEGKPMQMLKTLAKEGKTTVGGSYMAKSGKHVRNTLVIATPDGATYTHDKDIPSMGEGAYMAGGEDNVFLDEMVARDYQPRYRQPIPGRPGNNIDGVFRIGDLNVGGLLCWELIRTRTLKRLARGNVDLVVGGSGWPDWDPAHGAPGLNREQLENAARIYHSMILDMPLHFARTLRVPVVHATQVGFQYSGSSINSTSTSEDRILLRFLGNSVIADGNGTILAHRGREAGEGIIMAEITPGRLGEPDHISSDEFFIPTERPYIDDFFFEPGNRDYYFDEVAEA